MTTEVSEQEHQASESPKEPLLDEVMQMPLDESKAEYAEAHAWSDPQRIHAFSEPIRFLQAMVHPSGTLHLVWTSNNWLWYSRQEGDGWTDPQRMFVGTQPSAVMDAQGTLHVIFVHSFAGRYQVYYTRYVDPYWAFPYEISRTPGLSHNPYLTVSKNGLLYAVWEDDTPGFPSIYHAYNPEGYWINAPIPGVRGWRPALAFDGEDRLHLVWESPIPTGAGDDIFHTQMTPAGWTLPENISDSPRTDSSIPRVTGAADGTIHVVWQEQWGNRLEVGYARGRYASWTRPIALTRTGRNYAPQITAGPTGHVHVLWQDMNTLAYRYWTPGKKGVWHMAEALDRHISGVEETALTCDPQGRAHVFWTRKEENGWGLYYRYREAPPKKHKHYIPTILANG
ncbi:MAG: hypothetical protein GXO55_10670 [Chloroflexi bacterium]|nr:hypothetical protein [Chloroflexota bacterium]